MDIKGTAEQLVKRCLKKGADAAEVYIETGRNLSLDVRKGDIETVQEAVAAGAGIRVFVKGRMAFACSNDLGEKALEDAAGRAVEFARITTADPNNVLPDDKGETAVAGLYDPRIAQAPMEEKIELAKRLEKLAMKDPRVTKSDGAGYRESEGEVAIANSNGLLKGYRFSGCGFGVSVVAEKGEQKSSGSDSCSRRFYGDLKPAEDVAAKAARTACEALDPRPVKTQKAAVIFHADVAGALLGGILGAVNGERVLQGASFLAGKMDQRIGSELLTLVDDGTREKGMASAPFDGEGVPTRKRVIVDKGVLKGFMYNTAVARRAGVRSTGNASRGGFDGLPGIGPHNFFMLAGTAKYDDVIAATETGLLVKEVTGYGINPVNGNFSGGASGFWIENGRIAFPVRGLTIAGTADEILNGIDLVAGDLDQNETVAAPTVRIKLLQIGGE
ncbi:MAG: TldD/PmbA family protein [Acidobacteriota bacterium]